MKSYTFDASALISYFDGESNAHKVAELLEEIIEKNSSSYLNVVNLGEIYYHFLRTGGENTSNTILNLINTLPVKIIEADLEITIKAARLKAFNRMSYADCFAAATASLNDSILITSDKEFKQLEKEFKIYWI